MSFDHAKVRQTVDHFEVRSDGEACELLGWIVGIDATAIGLEQTEIELYAAPADEDVEYVEEKDDGSSTVRISLVGEKKAYRVARFKRLYATKDLHQRPYKEETPSYAVRFVLSTSQKMAYEWPFLKVSAEEAQELFDFGEFIPYVPVPDEETLLALAGEDLARGSLPAAPTLKIDFMGGVL